MNETLYTRCPYCRTTFRVLEPQLSAREGQVRCGHCNKVFNARGHLVVLTPSPSPSNQQNPLYEDYDPMRGPETITLRRPAPPDVAAENVPEPIEKSERLPANAEDWLGAEAQMEEPHAGEPNVDEPHADLRGRVAEASFAWEKPRPVSRWQTVGYGVLAFWLCISLLWQGAHHFRSAIAAHVPTLKPILQAYCERAGCRIEPIREASGMTIESSDLQADPAHPGLMILTVVLRNRLSYPLAFPLLELSLTDTQTQVVARRVFAPDEYVRDPDSLNLGLPAGEERPFKIFLDASSTGAEGYKIERFYL